MGRVRWFAGARVGVFYPEAFRIEHRTSRSGKTESKYHEGTLILNPFREKRMYAFREKMIILAKKKIMVAPHFLDLAPG
ncbi:MAG: hypothetical protein JW929_16300 [Anaerolineales bacterium]|nr:hypothetical protein [Anaerolineales bacterium]